MRRARCVRRSPALLCVFECVVLNVDICVRKRGHGNFVGTHCDASDLSSCVRDRQGQNFTKID